MDHVGYEFQNFQKIDSPIVRVIPPFTNLPSYPDSNPCSFFFQLPKFSTRLITWSFKKKCYTFLFFLPIPTNSHEPFFCLYNFLLLLFQREIWTFSFLQNLLRAFSLFVFPPSCVPSKFIRNQASKEVCTLVVKWCSNSMVKHSTSNLGLHFKQPTTTETYKLHKETKMKRTPKKQKQNTESAQNLSREE